MNRKFIVCMIGLILLSACNSGVKVKPVNLTYSTESQKAAPDTFWGDKELRKAFERYWSLRFDRQAPIKEIFSMEAPYFQEMVDEPFYNVYMRSGKTPNVAELQVQRMTKKTPNFYAIDCFILVNMPDGEKRDSYLTDYWVNVKGKWYHVVDDMMFLKL